MRPTGELRLLATLSQYALWIQVGYYAVTRERIRVVSPQAARLALLFLNAALLPVYSSARSDLVYAIVGALLVQFCLNRGSIRAKPLVIGAILVVLLTSTLTIFRSQGQTVSPTQIRTAALDSFVLTRTFADIPSTGNIVNAVPRSLPYAKGRTILVWASAPIPRSLWPDKPLISAGPTLGIVVYGTTRSGVPPGMIAESYWNFGLFGVVVLPGLCGVALRLLADRWSVLARSSISAALLLVGAGIPAGTTLVTNSIGAAAFQTLLALALLAPVVFVLRRSERRGTGKPERSVSTIPYPRASQGEP